jgi:hypothetical protein
MSQNQNVPVFSFIQKLKSLNGCYLVNRAKIYHILPQISTKNPKYFVKPSGRTTAYLNKYLYFLVENTAEQVIKEMRINWNFLMPATLELLQKRINENRKFYRKNDSKDYQNGIDLDQILNFMDVLKNLLKNEIRKYAAGLRRYWATGLWIEDDKVYRLKPGHNNFVSETFREIEHKLSDYAPGLKNYLSSKYSNLTNHINEIYSLSSIFQKELPDYRLDLMDADLKKILEKAKFNLIQGTTPIKLSEFEKKFYQKVETTVNCLLISVHSDPILQKKKEYILKMMQTYKFPRNAYYIKNYKYFPFEIQYQTPDCILVGIHTGQFIIENYQNGSPFYYLFPDAFVAVQLSQSIIKQKNVLPPLVVNRYTHPFLPEVNAPMQNICLGDTPLNELVGSHNSYIDRIMNYIFIGKKVLREGIHSRNSNTYHHQLSEEIFFPQRIYNYQLKNYKNIIISKYER